VRVLVFGCFLGVLILVPGPRFWHFVLKGFVLGILVLGFASIRSLGSFGSLRRSRQSSAATWPPTVLPPSWLVASHG
jgi:hypothetical protein